MKFETLSNTIPYAVGGKEKVLTYRPYPHIKIAMPGRHAKDTHPVGGDFVVMVTEKNNAWHDHQFNHSDIFIDLETKVKVEPAMAEDTMKGYLWVISGHDPERYAFSGWDTSYPTIPPKVFLRAVQCLALAEHRRYARFEAKFGGRYLPFRFAAGIVEGLWSAAEAGQKEGKGRIGVEWLEKDNGVPTLTQELFDASK